MPCYYPLTAWKSADLDDINSKNGKVKMVFREDQGFPNTKTELPCGQCIGCRLDRARMWAARIMNEAQLYTWNCFVTLTYKDDPITLNKDDIQQFMHNLRQRRERHEKKNQLNPQPIRFYQCGEYGEQFSRPHHHIILFNYYPSDAKYFKRHNGNNVYISEELSEVWPHGLHSVQELTYDSAAYCAKYILKKQTGERAEQHYNGLEPEFTTMSRRPGIGKKWFEKFKNDVYNHDRMVLGPNVILRPPRYYDELFELHHPTRLRELKRKRRMAATLNPDNCEDRRAVKAALAKLKEEKIKIRRLEKGE